LFRTSYQKEAGSQTAKSSLLSDFVLGRSLLFCAKYCEILDTAFCCKFNDFWKKKLTNFGKNQFKKKIPDFYRWFKSVGKNI
jgi:hypothetical protein